ncbi:IS110 family transposase [Candidatus Paracaedibacter symbiosus]|uniref:IS110 family transposase n=1 Tax=Candidatus Paracaedibacter symbiosus TaxID=244582 RepID=UPI0004F90039|nr:IS110 family transposase [Candidatus Paracaedibacter symbiosus]AIL12645.1 transposase [Candidatus Paracaedimonas acanthamoebae]AIL12663.1 transposase [Candidatus Paracaedimonas acanthamoebae]AIL13129.1 transposase [Candidatus Paracaedimonas acanthamoebae]AIL13438.1 transposase [Candidatus Paracaedimonas acanthamoebae]AIL13505.1 transposase [Candidatus Paracaedimonas acanthamoebae]
MTQSNRQSSMPIIHQNAAGIDIGAKFHVVAVGSDKAKEPVRTFQSFTTDLHAMAKWLKSCEVTSIAMESTGIYWIPAFEILENYGFEVFLVNPREAKNVPGRKTDVNDAQWIQRLHQFGLLRASFRPEKQITVLRAYIRQRERMLEFRASHIQHMQKALMQMNLQLHHVVSDITGATGMKIIRAIMNGERCPAVLAEHRDIRCKESIKTIEESLKGNYQEEHLFSLTQAVELFDYYTQKINECDRRIEETLSLLGKDNKLPDQPLPKARHRTKQPNSLSFDVRASLYQALGMDLTQIHGVGPSLALKLISECGTDMSRWPSSKHFTSWLCLSPGNKVSGGKVLSSRTRRSSSRAAAALRLAAVTIGKTNTALGAFYRRLSARIGKSKAITATARKMAVLFFNALRYGMQYVDPGANYYEARYQKRVLDNLSKRAAALGYILQENKMQDLVQGVS